MAAKELLLTLRGASRVRATTLAVDRGAAAKSIGGWTRRMDKDGAFECAAAASARGTVRSAPHVEVARRGAP
jgi:hypothetical protein